MKKDDLTSPVFARLENSLRAGKIDAVDSFWNEIEKRGTPILDIIENDDENLLVTLVWKGSKDVKAVYLDGELFHEELSQNGLCKFRDTNIWYRSYKVRKDITATYIFKIDINGNGNLENLQCRIDPFNPEKLIGPRDEDNPEENYLLSEMESVIKLPEVKENKWSIRHGDIKKGNLEMFRFESKILNNNRRVWVYTPADYDKNEKEYDYLVFTDGYEYINMTEAPVIFDNLIAEKLIKPICVVFVETHKDRDIELTCNELFKDFIVKEIVPWLHSNYNVSNNPDRSVIAGFSYGGLSAAFIAYHHSDIFGKVLSQSGSYWWKNEDGDYKEWLIKKYKESEKLPLKFHNSIGTLETRFPYHYSANRRMLEVLKEKGYEVDFVEFAGGHSNYDCSIVLSEALIALLGNK